MTSSQAATPVAQWRRSVPGGLPYVVAPNGRRDARFFGSLLGFQVAVPLVAWVLIAGTTGGRLVPPMSAPLWLMLGTLLTGCMLTAVTWMLSAGGGPRLAAGPEGLWLRGINRPIRAHFLAWEELDRIWLDRKHYLCLRPRDPAFVADWRGQAGVEVRAAIRRHGAPFAVPLGKHSDRPEAEVLAALRSFSAGRVEVQDLGSH